MRRYLENTLWQKKGDSIKNGCRKQTCTKNEHKCVKVIANCGHEIFTKVNKLKNRKTNRKGRKCCSREDDVCRYPGRAVKLSRLSTSTKMSPRGPICPNYSHSKSTSPIKLPDIYEFLQTNELFTSFVNFIPLNFTFCHHDH